MKYFSIIILTTIIACNTAQNPTTMPENQSNPSEKNETYSNEELKKTLSPELYHIARESGTERPFTGKYNDYSEPGKYNCAVCGQYLFESDAKFNSSCGWPSFFAPATDSALVYLDDNTHGRTRTEVRCGKCDSHLGHVFDDGPPPTGKRFCINSVVIQHDSE